MTGCLVHEVEVETAVALGGNADEIGDWGNDAAGLEVDIVDGVGTRLESKQLYTGQEYIALGPLPACNHQVGISGEYEWVHSPDLKLALVLPIHSERSQLRWVLKRGNIYSGAENVLPIERNHTTHEEKVPLIRSQFPHFSPHIVWQFRH